MAVQIASREVRREKGSHLVDDVDVLFSQVSDGVPGLCGHIDLLGDVVVELLFDGLGKQELGLYAGKPGLVGAADEIGQGHPFGEQDQSLISLQTNLDWVNALTRGWGLPDITLYFLSLPPEYIGQGSPRTKAIAIAINICEVSIDY